MAFTKFNEDMEIIAKLSDEPNDADGLTAAELKARFDLAGKLLKQFLNEVLLTELGGAGGAGSIGVGPVNGTAQGETVQAALDSLAQQIVEATVGAIPDKSIAEEKLADLAVGTRVLSELAVTAAKLAEAAVTEEKLATGAVTNTKLATGAVTNEKTDFSAGFAPAGPIKLVQGVHYFAGEADLPEDTEDGRLYFVQIPD